MNEELLCSMIAQPILHSSFIILHSSFPRSFQAYVA